MSQYPLVLTTDRGAANGVASLDASSLLPLSQFRELGDPRRYGGVGNGTVDDYSAWAGASAAIASGGWIAGVAGTWKIGTSLSISAADLHPGCVLKPASGVTITFTGSFRASLSQHFDLSLGGAVVFASTCQVPSIYPEWWGVTVDGTTDDTNAFINALTSANKISAGTFETSGDTYGVGGGRQRFPLTFPIPGTLRTTRAVPIRWAGIEIQGLLRASAKSWEVPQVIKVDHAGDGFSLNLNYTAWSFVLRKLRLDKFGTAYQYQGAGVAMRGPFSGEAYLWGPELDACELRAFQDGIYIEQQGSTSLTTAGARLRVRDSTIAANGRYGIYVAGHLVLGEIRDNSIIQNGVAGLICGGQGLSITDNDFEGQPRPLEVVNGSNSSNVTVARNYFESIVSTGTQALILLKNVHGFKVFDNHISNAGSFPPVGATNCDNGDIDCDATLLSCHNVKINGRLVPPVSTAANQQVSCSYNLSVHEPPRGNAIPTGAVVLRSAGSIVPRTIGGTPISTYLCSGTYRLGYGGVPNVPSGQWLYVSFLVEYTGTVPTTPGILIAATQSGGGVTFEMQNPVSAVRVGDAIQYTFGIKNTGSALSAVAVYVYPFDESTTTAGTGAYISSVLAWVKNDTTNEGISITSVASMLADLPAANVRTITASDVYLDSDDIVLCDSTAGAMSYTLPYAYQRPGRPITIVNVGNTAHTVTVQTPGGSGETIKGVGTAALGSRFDKLQLNSDGVSAWY